MDKTVLVIEDDTLTRKGIAQALADAGLKVTEAVNGSDGLRIALESHPDVILTDVRMPGISGLEMVAELRKDDWGAGVPILIMTTDETTASVNQAITSGVTAYLTKSDMNADRIVEEVLNTVR